MKESEFPNDPDLSSFFDGEIPASGTMEGNPLHKAPQDYKATIKRVLLVVSIASGLILTVNDIFTAWLVHFFK